MMQEQKNKSLYSIFLDVSGSVGGSLNYWDTVKNIFSEYIQQIQNYYLWDSNIQKIDQEKFYYTIITKLGRGGTQPSVVARQCVQKQIKNIILITDGQVGNSQVQSCDRYLQNHQFQSSICYIIGTSSYQSVNMSVVCPFTRNCQNKVFKKQKQKQMETVAQFKRQDYQILENLDTINLHNFETQYDKIQGLIIALNMGKQGNIPLKDKLVLLKKRLIRQLAIQKGLGKKDLSQTIRQHLLNNDFLSGIQQMKKVSEEYMKDNITVQLQKKITHLINLCGDLRGKYDLNEIKSNKMKVAVDAKEGKIQQQINIQDLSKNKIQCPILMDQDVPQILIDQCQPLLLGVEKAIVDDISACPLRLLNYPDLKAKLKSRLSNFVGVMNIHANFKQNLNRNPFTQNMLLGGIPLGTHKSHVQVGNYTLAKLISGGKILGNMNLYYALIWYLIKQGSIQYLKDIEKNATEHLIFRLKNSKTYASMCGQSQFITTQVNTDIALWFCVNSGYLNQPVNRDSFRFHVYDIKYMAKIVQTLGYPIQKGFISHYSRTKLLFILLSRAKLSKFQIQSSLNGLYQNGIFIDQKNVSKKIFDIENYINFVPIDGQASEQQKVKIRNQFKIICKQVQNLTDQEIYYIGNLIKRQKSISDYILDYNLVVQPLPKAKTNWKYGNQKFEDTLKICPNTLRPFYLNNGSKTWSQLCEDKIKLNKQEIFRGYNYFQEFVSKYQKMPSVDELVLFFYNRTINSQNNKCDTLPYMTQQWAKSIINNYKSYFYKLNMKYIKKAFNDSRQIENRNKIAQQ